MPVQHSPISEPRVCRGAILSALEADLENACDA
jgi:hypothetical protein